MNQCIETLWLMSIQACVLILVVLFVRILLQNYKKVYAYSLWFLVLVRLLCPVLIESSWSLQPDISFLPEMTQAVTVMPHSVQENHEMTDEPVKIPVPSEMPIVNTEEQFLSTNENSKPIYVYLQGLYVIGVLCFTIYFAVQYAVIKKKVAFAVREKQNIWLCEKIQSPFVMGVICPKIYLPMHMDDNEKRYILRHEFAHIAHKDPLIRMLGSMALILHWWNPLVWYAVHKMNQDMEMFCDETALVKATLEERKAYSNSLLQFAMKQSGLAVTVSFGESNTELRIKNVLRKKRNSMIVCVLVGLIGVLCVILFLTSPKHEDNDEKVEESVTEIQEMEETQIDADLQEYDTQTVKTEQEEYVQQNGETESEEIYTEGENEDFYELTSTFSKSKIENYAKEIRTMILTYDWEKLSEEIAYPIKIAGVKYNDAEEFRAAPLDTIVTEEFIQAIEKENCEEMFHNWQGIMMGETGEIWLSEFYDTDLDANILQVIAINMAEPEPEPIIEGNGVYASKSWYEAYKTILKDWTTIEQYGDFSYLKMYFDIDYEFDNYYLCDIDGNGIPELMLHSDYMGITAIFTYDNNQIHYLTYDAIYGINKETGEIIIKGHWHGAGGSGEAEWKAYQVKNNEAKYTMYIDSFYSLDPTIENPYTIYQPDTGEYEKQENSEEYDRLYAIHVTPCVLQNQYQRYDLNDLNGLDVIQ